MLVGSKLGGVDLKSFRHDPPRHSQPASQAAPSVTFEQEHVESTEHTPFCWQVGGDVQSPLTQHPASGMHDMIVLHTCSPGGQVHAPASQNSPVTLMQSLGLQHA